MLISWLKISSNFDGACMFADDEVLLKYNRLDVEPAKHLFKTNKICNSSKKKKAQPIIFQSLKRIKIMGIIKNIGFPLGPIRYNGSYITRWCEGGLEMRHVYEKYWGLYMSREKMRFKRCLYFVFSHRCMCTYIKNVKYKHKNACTLHISIYQTSRALI